MTIVERVAPAPGPGQVPAVAALAGVSRRYGPTAGEAILQATCREKPLYGVEELCQAPELRVVRFDAAAAEVEVR